MNFKQIGIAIAATVVTASAAGQALAQDRYGDRQDSGYAGETWRDGQQGQREDWRRNGRDEQDSRFRWDQGGGGGFYDRGDVEARTQRVERWIQELSHTGQLDRQESTRAWQSLRIIRTEAYYARRDGTLTPRERRSLNARLDRLTGFLQQSRNDDDDRHDRRW